MKRRLTLLLCLTVLLAAPWAGGRSEGQRYGAWLPYWEISDAMDEAEALSGTLDTAVAFACIFDAKDQPLMLSDADTLYTLLTDALTGTDTAVYLSVVNDVELAPGQYDNKSVDLLNRLFADDLAMSNHLEALTALIDRYGLTGLELDYENLKSDTDLWSRYAAFLTRLWTVCERDGVQLRVVLPWDAPKYATLPVGPIYSVMCYNLYGYHSGPGPKADTAFLQTTCALYASQPYRARMAFATGGFSWCEGDVTALTQVQAAELLSQAQVTPTRDAASAVLTAAYTQDGATHTVWYADAQTLAAWRAVCEGYGFTDFDLFRLGGNDLTDWQSKLN